MTTVAVICEYNLFHNGHARLIRRIRERFGTDTLVLSLMSGNFTQRGIPAATDKYTRARAALDNGSDLTLELPAPYACSVAQRFAAGAVRLLDALGCVNYLAFGSESGDLGTLQTVCENRASVDFERALCAALARAGADESYLRVREQVYAQRYGAVSIAPNDMLALEYLAALRDTSIAPALFVRTGSESASAARNAFLSGDGAALAALVPESALALYDSAPRASERYLSRAILYWLRMQEPVELARYSDVTLDLAYRFRRIAEDSANITEFFTRCATKKYTRARIRRGVLACMLGITDAHFAVSPTYTLLLSASKRGCTALAGIRKRARIPIYDKGVQISDALARTSDMLYTLAMDPPADMGAMLRKSPVIEK